MHKPFNRRRFMQWLLATGSVSLLGPVSAHHTETHFEEDSAHHIVYQLNKADPKYISHILFSAGELLRKYGDDIEIVIAVYAEGIHLLGKRPKRPIPLELQQKASSLAAYGVAFHACGNTLKAVRWTKKDLLDFAKEVPIGVEDIMLLQEKGFSYISW
ncbi:DsrE family protein, partial [Thiolapillus sp.]|uniref:DsrE family protein n=1 Tax=Thiolapillus sp. TaxID=2017437 RepID=UPI003AF50030